MRLNLRVQERQVYLEIIWVLEQNVPGEYTVSTSYFSLRCNEKENRLGKPVTDYEWHTNVEYDAHV